MTPAFAYYRVSGIGQKDGDGFTRQQSAVSAFAATIGAEVKREFRDCFTGSKDGLDRPDLNELLLAIETNGVRLVLVENATRLARDLMVGEIILQEFKKLGVKVVSVDGGVDLTVGNNDPTAKLIRQILSCLAEWDKTMLVHKLAVARKRIRDKGLACDGQPPYGFRPGEDVAIKVIRKLHEDGKTLLYTATCLNKLGLKPRKGTGRWHPQTVKRAVGRVVA